MVWMVIAGLSLNAIFLALKIQRLEKRMDRMSMWIVDEPTRRN